jgi:heat shock protein HtpX
LYEQIAKNKRRTVLMIIGSFVFLGAVGFALGAVFYSPAEGIVWMCVGLVIAGIQSFVSLRYGDKLVLRATRARAVSPEENPRLHNLVEGMAIAAGIPKPDIYVVPEQAPNAYATGRDPEHASIAVTEGLLEMMNRVELEGVLAHEMSHILDRDMLVNTVVGTLVGAVVLITEFMFRMWFWGGLSGNRRSSSSSSSGGGMVQVVFLVAGIALLILAPIFAQLIRMSVSRRREYLADAQGAMLTRYPPGLASALRKIADSPNAMRVASNATNHFWLNEPTRLRRKGEKASWMDGLFSSHPPIQERIRILEDM